MYLKILQNVAVLVALQNRPSTPPYKIEFLEEQFHNEKLSSAHKFRKLKFPLNFLNNP